MGLHGSMSAARIDNEFLTLVMEFPLTPLRTKHEFAEAVMIMKRLAKRLSSLSVGESNYLSELGDLIRSYELKLPALDKELSPQEALKFLMEENNLSQNALVEFVGYKSNLSAFLNGHRGLSKRAAARLAEYFHVSPALFLPKE